MGSAVGLTVGSVGVSGRYLLSFRGGSRGHTRVSLLPLMTQSNTTTSQRHHNNTLQHHNNITTTSRSNITTTSQQQHNNITTTSQQHHNITTTSQQHHNNITTTIRSNITISQQHHNNIPLQHPIYSLMILDVYKVIQFTFIEIELISSDIFSPPPTVTLAV